MQNITESELPRPRGSNKQRFSQINPPAQDRFGFKTFRRSPPPQSPFHASKQKLNISCASQQPERKRSASPSALSAQQEECYRSIQISLLSENRNLKEHNTFLLAQIHGLFEKEKKQGEALSRVRRDYRELQRINLMLQKQLEGLTGHTLREIERIQSMLRSEKQRQEEIMMSSQCSPRKSEGLQLETEETVNNNLQELKEKVKSIIYDPKHIYSPNHQIIPIEDESILKGMALDTQHTIRERIFKQTNQLKITEDTMKNTAIQYLFDQQLPSPRSAVIHTPYNGAEQRRTAFKR